MTWRKILPFCATVAALLAGLFSIFKSSSGEFILAAQFIMLAMFLDGLDGKLARLLEGTTEFGAELDTFVDITAFGIAPAVLAYQMLFKDCGFLGMMFVSFMVLSGAIRLSRFKVVDPFRGEHGYLGLPITAQAGWVAAFVIIAGAGVLDEDFVSLTHGPVAALVWGGSLAMLVLQVSHVHYFKPTKSWFLFIGGAFLIIMLFAKLPVAFTAALILLAYGFFYVFCSPFFNRRYNIIDVAGEDAAAQDQEAARQGRS